MQEDEGVTLKVTEPDFYYAQSKYDIDIFSGAFRFPKEKILLSGLPRNDELCYVKSERIDKIKQKLNIPLNKKVIMYAPTYREYERDKVGCILSKCSIILLKSMLFSTILFILFSLIYSSNSAFDL